MCQALGPSSRSVLCPPLGQEGSPSSFEPGDLSCILSLSPVVLFINLGSKNLDSLGFGDPFSYHQKSSSNILQLISEKRFERV